MQKLENWLLIVFLFLSTIAWDFFLHIGEYTRIGRVKFFLLAAALIAAIRIAKKWHLSLGLFYFYAVAYYLYIGMPPLQRPFDFFTLQGTTHAIQMDGTIDIILLTATLLATPEIYRRLKLVAFENIILVSAAIHAVVGLLNLRGIYPFLVINNMPPDEALLPVGLMWQHTLLGPFLVFAFVVAVRRIAIGNLFYIPVAILNLLVALLTTSAMTALSLGGALLVITYFYAGVGAALLALIQAFIMGFGLLHFTEFFNLHGRLKPWSEAYVIWEEKRLFGFGPGMWGVIAEKLKLLDNTKAPWLRLHNEPLQGLIEYGLFGVSLITFFALKVTEAALSVRHDKEAMVYIAGVVVFGINAVGNFPLHVTPHGEIFMYCVYGLLEKARTGYGSLLYLDYGSGNVA